MSTLECLTCGLVWPGSEAASCPGCAARGERAAHLIVTNERPSAVPADATGRLRIETSVLGDVHTIALAGELDMASGPTVRQIMSDICAEDARELVLDLSAIDFVDSEGFRVLLLGRELCREHRCNYSLIPGPGKVQRLFDLTRLVDKLRFRKPRRADAMREHPRPDR
jgi:anti-sigma B factor antagonist